MEFCAKTDIGRKRKINQDYVFGTGEPLGALPNLYLLADGMGGHKAGDFASRFLIEQLKESLAAHTDGPVIRLLSDCIADINRKLHEEAEKNPDLAGMGTTLVACVVEGQTATFANIGDSRAYLVHKNSIRQVTRDHSYVEEMVERGYMRRGSKDYLAAKNIITRAVGIDDVVDADFFEVELEAGDMILMCSDGLTNMVDDGSIFNILKDDASVAEKIDTLIDVANINGGKDNIAVILIAPCREVSA